MSRPLSEIARELRDLADRNELVYSEDRARLREAADALLRAEARIEEQRVLVRELGIDRSAYQRRTFVAEERVKELERLRDALLSLGDSQNAIAVARIQELLARLAKADRLAEAVEEWNERPFGEVAWSKIVALVRAYRDSKEGTS